MRGKQNETISIYCKCVWICIFCNPAYADDMTIEMLNKREDGAKMVYSEDIARIDVGDTITWVPIH